jgi:hypothetical protein
MKKLLSVFAAAAMLFGFASCSGDLHDDVKPAADSGSTETPAGSWYYISAGNPDRGPTIIFNNADKQTANIPNTKSTGNVFFKIVPYEYTIDRIDKRQVTRLSDGQTEIWPLGKASDGCDDKCTVYRKPIMDSEYVDLSRVIGLTWNYD